MAHWEGDPEYCREACGGPHRDDEYTGPESCPTCGGNGRACAALPGGCREASYGTSEWFEGSTGYAEWSPGRLGARSTRPDDRHGMASAVK